MNQNNSTLPQHVAIIMDGNGRWAKKRLLPRVAGHKKGVNTIKKIAKYASQKGIQLLTLYAFSTENWGRPEEEVSFLMDLPQQFFDAFLPELIENNCKVTYIGDISALPQKTQRVLEEAVNASQSCTGLILNFAINYGGQQEIVRATQLIAQEVKDGKLSVEEIDKQVFANYLYTSEYQNLAYPDLLIRTSGEQRISNFLLWQLAYSEFYFTNIYWPDFDEKAFEEALQFYQSRQRRFGKV